MQKDSPLHSDVIFNNHHTVMLLIKPESGAILDANPAACSFYGYTREQLISLKISDLNILTGEQTQEDMNSAISGEKNSFVFRHRLASGQIRNVEVRSGPVEIGGQKLLFSVIKDISQRVQTELTLQKSEQRYRDLVESAHDWTWETDAEGVYTYSSNQVYTLLGYQPEEVLGKKPFDFMAEDEAARVKLKFDSLCKKPIPFHNLVNVNLHKNGRAIILETNGMPFFDENGALAGFRGMDRDITERMRIENTLQFLAQCGYLQSDENFFESLARYLAESLEMDFVCIDRLEGDGLSARTVAVYHNGEFEDNVTYSLKDTPCGDVVGKTVCCFPSSVCKLFPQDQVLKDLLAESYVGVTLWSYTGQPIGLIAVIGRNPLVNRPLAESVLKLVAVRAAGELERMTAEESLLKANVELEIRVVKRTEELEASRQELARQNVRLMESYRTVTIETAERIKVVESLRVKEQMLIHQSRLAAMGEMIGNIAHQWRQPLNALGLSIQQLALNYDFGNFDREFLVSSVDKSMELIRYMSKTIDDFRNYFSPDKEKVKFRAQEAIGSTLSLIEAGFKNQQITIEVEMLTDPVIFGHQNEYAQALLNILNNARDALTDKQLVRPKILLSLSTEEEKAVVTITDNAGGIPEDIIDKIFDPYFTTKGPDKGTGIGLFMSKTIIERNMGGLLTVRNTGNGAEFRIEVGPGFTPPIESSGQ